jgi:hypothetical protein
LLPLSWIDLDMHVREVLVNVRSVYGK